MEYGQALARSLVTGIINQEITFNRLFSALLRLANASS